MLEKAKNWFKNFWDGLATPAKIYFGLGLVTMALVMILMLPILFTGVGAVVYLAIIPIVAIAIVISGLLAALINIVYRQSDIAGWGLMVLLLVLGVAPAGM